MIEKSLKTLFLIEICEGFAFYGIGAILTLFMVQFLNLNLSFALLIYGVYSGLVYISTLLGGHLCDKYIGSRSLINVGSVTMMAGLLLLSYGASLNHPLTPLHSSFLFNTPEILLIISLICVIIGAGFLRVSISSIVSALYQKDENELESNFTFLNMALNIGAVLASLILGLTIGEGNPLLYKYGFLILASSLIIGIIIYNLFRNKYLINENGEKVGTKPLIKTINKFNEAKDKINETTDKIKENTNKIKLTKIEKNHIKFILIIEVISLIFFIGFEVLDSTLMFFAKDYVLSSINYLPFKVTPEMIKFMEPLGVIIFSPIIISYFASKKEDYNLVSKIIMGIIVLLISYIIFFVLAIMADNGVTNISIIFIIIMEFIRSISEILVLPIILSIVSKYAPKQYLSRLMGLFYCFLAGAYTLSGFMASFFPDKNNIIIPKLFGIIPVANFKTFSLIFIIMYLVLLFITFVSKNKIKSLI